MPRWKSRLFYVIWIILNILLIMAFDKLWPFILTWAFDSLNKWYGILIYSTIGVFIIVLQFALLWAIITVEVNYDKVKRKYFSKKQ